MTRGEMKLQARSLIAATRPHPCFVTLALLAFGWVINYLAQRIGGQPIVLDLNAVETMDLRNMVRVDLANTDIVSTGLLLAFQAVNIILSFGYFGYLLRVVRRESAGFGDLLDGFGIAGRAIVLTLLVDVLVTLASVLFFVPGIILSCAYSMAFRLQMDHPDWSPVRCMRESRYMMRGHKWEFFVLQLSFLGWLILAMFPGVSVFVKPYVSLTETVFYENLRTRTQQPPLEF